MGACWWEIVELTKQSVVEQWPGDVDGVTPAPEGLPDPGFVHPAASKPRAPEMNAKNFKQFQFRHGG
ncbi:hypothetical protein D3C83_291800 [compost metagenome]